MKNRQRVIKLEQSTTAQSPLTKEQYQKKYETFNERKVEIFGYSQNQLIPFDDAMYEEYLKNYTTPIKMTSKDKRAFFRQKKQEIISYLLQN